MKATVTIHRFVDKKPRVGQHCFVQARNGRGKLEWSAATYAPLFLGSFIDGHVSRLDGCCLGYEPVRWFAKSELGK